MLTRTLSALAAAALTAGTLALATPLHAAEAESRSVAIAIDDLDLSRSKDVATLERRVRGAARAICGWHPTAPLRERRDADACEAQVLADARSDIQTAIAARTSRRLALRAP
jgi:UrcA family protein